MFVAIVDPSDLLNDQYKAFTERRFLFALSRFDSRIRQASVTFSGPQVTDKLLTSAGFMCKVTIVLKGANDVSLVESDEDLDQCISRAAQRSGRWVRRAIANAQQGGKGRLVSDFTAPTRYHENTSNGTTP